MHVSRFRFGLIACLHLFAVGVQAESIPPSPLDAWRGWALQGQEFRACPLISGAAGVAADDFVCAWPGVLAITTDGGGAAFVQHWKVDIDSWAPLAGDDEHWPQQVTVDGIPAVVVDRAGPTVRLGAGSHDVRGRIPWQERPQTLHVPASIGLVALGVDGKPVLPIQRDGDQLTLGRAAVAATEADSIDVRVHRRLVDGVPADLTTVITLDISGAAREETIGPVLPDGFAPLSLQGDWPARIDGDGRLHVRVQAGSAVLTLEARATVPLADVVARMPAAPWPKQEVWSYEASPRLRVTNASADIQIDPRQAQVPAEWQGLPAFALGDGAHLRIEQRSRGLAGDDRNRLSLQREMWLDFDGEGWFARDHVRGEMLQGWRFDAALPYLLERADATGAAQNGRRDEPLLVTHGATPTLSGVEWRTPAVELAAGLRIDAAPSELPIGGWQETFDRVDTTLHLPHGYRVLGAIGADVAQGSWIGAWTLLDVFIAAVVVLLAWRLFGGVGGLIAFAYLVLGYQESGAPLWSLLAVIALGLVVRALPAGRLHNVAGWAQRVALVLLVLLALPFIADEWRYALHPQLENDGGFAGVDRVAGELQETMAAKMTARPAPPPPPAMNAPASAPAESGGQQLDTATVTGSDIRRVDIETASPIVSLEKRKAATSQRDAIGHYSQSTVVQTGAGEPSWRVGSDVALSWTGPVLPTQTVRLVIAPPWLVRPLRIALGVLLAVLVIRLSKPMWPRALVRRSMAWLPIAFATASMIAAQPARAQSFPTQEMLKELRAHLTEAPKCAPGCATIARAEIAARGDEVRVAIEAHAAERVALPLPSDESNLALRSISIDGAAQDGLVRAGPATWIAVPRGVHRMEMVFSAFGDKVGLAFPLRPMRALVMADDWQASGLADDRLLTETLTLARLRGSDAATTASATEQEFAPYVRIERNLDIGLDWSVATTATRLAPLHGGFSFGVPLIAGEHVASAGLKVFDGKVTASIDNDAAQTGWRSTLDKGATLVLTAPALGDRAEVWRVLVSPTWHVEFSGVPGVAAPAGSDHSDYHTFEFAPLPGESLTLTVTQPLAMQGATRAIDAVSLQQSFGQRASTSTLRVQMRASQGGEQVLTLPPGAEVLGVSRAGHELNLRPRDGKLGLPLVPGAQSFEIRLREDVAVSAVARTPTISFDVPVANLALAVDLPEDRWLLATTGPALGPAVLYWSELLVMLLLAWGLSRIADSPLRLWQWILLGVGFSTFSWMALLVVVAWLFAMGWRERATLPASARRFNVVQVALALLTVVALVCIAAAIPQGLLGAPDMHVAGNGSSAHALRWFADRSSGALPTATAISLPLWVYKLAMLAWALWLASTLVGWLRRAFAAWTQGGYWRAVPRRVVEPARVDLPDVRLPEPPTP